MQYHPFTSQSSVISLDSISGTVLDVYALRRAFTGYVGPAIEVRRDSDDALQDINFLPDGSLDTASLLTFCGAASGFIKVFYNQKTLFHIAATVNSRQPRIVNAGVLETTVLGNPRADGLGTSFMNVAAVDYTGETRVQLSAAMESNSADGQAVVFAHGSFPTGPGIELQANAGGVAGALGVVAGNGNPGANVVAKIETTPTTGTIAVHTAGVFDSTLSPQVNRATGLLNNATYPETTTANLGTGWTAHVNQSLRMFGRSATTLQYAGRVMGAAAMSNPSAADQVVMDTFMQSLL